MSRCNYNMTRGRKLAWFGVLDDIIPNSWHVCNDEMENLPHHNYFVMELFNELETFLF
jgi:hypothetical protein